jgi:superfamily II DNA or RNA helicase
MQLIASPALEEQDIEALTQGTEKRDEILRRVAARGLEDVQDLLSKDRLNALAWLIAKGLLEVRLAVRLNDHGQPSRGIYHEKLGIFSDPDQNHVAFSGSANETSGGLVDNFESIDVFWSWDDPQGRVQRKIDDFEELWSNQTPGVQVVEFTEISLDLLQRYQISNPAPVAEDLPQAPVLQISKPPRPYQEEAIEAWFNAHCRGIFAMATGSGKTLTALHAMNRLAAKEPLVAIIACPYVNLAEQWVRELKEAGLSRVVKCFGSQSAWLSELESGLSSMMIGKRTFLPVVVVNKTFLTPVFQGLLRPDKIPHLLIADEMHNLGAENLRQQLNPAITYRLGLSATPERHMDEEGTSALFDYFGEIVFTYTLKQAIEAKSLCPYHYHPVLVDLTEEESVEYQQLSIEIGKEMQRKKEKDGLRLRLKTLLLRRARLLASAHNKLPILMSTLEGIRARGAKVEKALIYCGDGQVEDPVDDEGMLRQLDATLKILGEQAGLRVRRFSAGESMQEREDLLRQMRSQRLDGLVAIRCLDEGIDLPDIRMGFILASSTNPRQFIQRRGRLLRRAPGKDRSEIWDFVVSPPDLSGLVEDSLFNIERRLVQRELSRVLEFCETALNGDAAKGVLLELRRRYNLLADE